MAVQGMLLLLFCELLIFVAGAPAPVTRADVDRRVGTMSDGTGRDVYVPWRTKEIDTKVHPYLYDFHRYYVVLNATTDASGLDQASRKLLQTDKKSSLSTPVTDPILRGALRYPAGSGRASEAAEVRVFAIANGDDIGGADPGAALEAELIALGARDVARSGLSVTGYIPLTIIPLLSGLSQLQVIRPSLAMTNAIVGEGGFVMRADLVRATYGFNGTGIRVGVLSDSFDKAPKDATKPDAAADFLNGELPLDTIVLQDADTAQTDEGRAMMQLVYDTAPGVSLAFHTAFVGEVGMANGIKKLAQVAGCKVIVDDVTFMAEPFFLDGPIAQAVTFVYNLGVAYFSSAGNLARLSYMAPYRPSGLYKEHGEMHDYDSGAGVATSMHVQFASGGCLVLQWDDIWKSVTQRSGAVTDMDIYAYNYYTGALVAAGTTQNLGNDAFEYLCFPKTTDATYATGGHYNVTIEHYAGPRPTILKWIAYNFQAKVLEWATDSGTCAGHANAAGGLGVAATLYSKTPVFGKSPAEMEAFSSAGGTPIYFGSDNVRLARPIYRQNPRLTAPDGTPTSFFGSGAMPRFYGTSAAAPHAAAAAAILLQVNPRLTVDELYNVMAATATPIMQPVYHELSGYGLINVQAAVDMLTNECPLGTDAECVDGLFCNGVETCNNAIKLCMMGPLPCTGTSYCDESLDQCVQCLESRHCDDGLYCNGPETCSNGACQAGTPPCPAAECFENSDNCASNVRFEVGTVTTGLAGVTVTLRKRYTYPVVVCSVFQKNNFQPTITRVRDVTGTSFRVRLQSPGGNATVLDEVVHYIVMEAGRWQVGTFKFEAVRYEPQYFDYKNVFNGDLRTPLWSTYTDIVVLGQVMTENNARYVQFFSRGGSYTVPPTPSALYTGIHVGEDPNRSRVQETIGYIVMQKQDTHLFFNTSEAEIYKTGATVAGVSNSALGVTTLFKAAFAAPPGVCVVTMMGMAGLDGGWATLWGYNTSGITKSSVVLITDEDQLSDVERLHKVEVVGYMCFSTPVAYPPCTSDSQCSDGIFCNGAERCSAAGDCLPPLTTSPCGTDQCSESLGKCVECTAESDCSGRTDGRVRCNVVTNKCVACTSSFHCSDGLFCNGIEVCDAGACKAGTPQCVGSSHPVCDEDGDACVQCTSASHCVGTGHPVCDPVVRVCVDCVTAADCPTASFCSGTPSCSAGICVVGSNPCAGTALPWCDALAGTCRQCSNDSHCAGRSDGKLRCHPTQFECRQCVDNAGCSDGLFCNGQETCTESGTCASGVAPCGEATPVCDEAGDICVGCLQHSDCNQASSTPFCGAQRTCVACTLDAHCPDLDGILCNNVASCSAAGVCIENAAPPCSSGVVCDDNANRCVQPCAADADCNPAGAVCVNYRRCQVSTGLCFASTEDPCFRNGMMCDIAADVCRSPTCSLDMDCDDGSFCTGQEACKDGACSPGTNPCPGQVCDEGLDMCAPYMEAGSVMVEAGADGTEVTLQNTYKVPVVVASLVNKNNRGSPVLVRMRNVTTTSFRLTLGAIRSGAPAPVADTVHYVVMEEGSWTVGGFKMEARRLQTSRFDGTLLGWDGASLSYHQLYRSPIVLASVMTSNNAAQWSAAWMKGLFGGAPRASSPLVLGAHVATNSSCAGCVPETIGFIVMETTGKAHGQINLVEFEAARGPLTVMGMGDRAGEFQYLLRTSFRSGAPGVVVANLATQNGPRGGWLHVLSNSDASYFTAAVDEEGRAADGIRTHPRETVNYVAFSAPFRYP